MGDVLKRITGTAARPEIPQEAEALSQRSEFREAQGKNARTMANILALIDEKRREQGDKLKALREIQTKREALLQELRKLDQEQADILTSFDA